MATAELKPVQKSQCIIKCIIKCQNESFGCGWQGRIDEQFAHLRKECLPVKLLVAKDENRVLKEEAKQKDKEITILKSERCRKSKILLDQCVAHFQKDEQIKKLKEKILSLETDLSLKETCQKDELITKLKEKIVSLETDISLKNKCLREMAAVPPPRRRRLS